MQKIILVDFDGTITKKDTCYGMIEKFSIRAWDDIDKKWMKGEMTTQECSIALFERMNIDAQRLKDFLYTIEIDDYFIDFVHYCEEQSIPLVITSDGYDFNIRTILDKYGLSYLEFYSNGLSFNRDQNYQLFFPNDGQICDQCGNCKIKIYQQFKTENQILIYIGDGYSDRCMAQEADILFAKKHLALYCEKEGIPYIPYEDFKDIKEYLIKSEYHNKI